MPTIPIVPQTTASAPFAVEQLQSLEAELLAAYAEWDGTGASGDFLPCLAIYSDAGVRLGRVFPNATVRSGDSAVVTYAPFPGGIGQQSQAVSLTEEVDSATVTLPSDPGGAGVFVPWTPVSTSPVWNHATANNPVSKVGGLLVVTLQVEQHSGTPLAPGETLFAQLLIPGPAGTFPGVINLVQSGEATAALPAVNLQLAAAGIMTAAQPASLNLRNNGAAPIDVTYIIRSSVVES